MKKLILHTVIIVLFMINTAASCDSENEDPKPEPDKFSIIGTWHFHRFEMEQTQTDGNVQKAQWLTADRGIDISWDIKSDGELIAREMTKTEGEKTAKGRWELKVTKLDEFDPSEIDEGTLTVHIQGSTLVYKIMTANFMFRDKLTSTMTCEVDATQASPLKLKTIMRYFYEKVK